jgi:hypothetical protein
MQLGARLPNVQATLHGLQTTQRRRHVGAVTVRSAER